jgi:hypothetical protein
LEATELSHPLPGERTAVFVFIQYVSLGKKLSRILDLLYTTTQRRDGARKIAELDRDLRVWNQNLGAVGILFEIGSSGSIHSTASASHFNETTTLWLQLMANITMTLIHRPGLSFDDTIPEFGNCLRACLDSGNSILSLVKTFNIPTWLRNISLVGPATIFQSALVHVYSELKYRTFKPHGFPALDTSTGVISRAISILTLDVQDSRVLQTERDFYSESLNEIIVTLRTLLSSLSIVTQDFTDPANVDESMPISNTETFDDENWSGNALEALNYMAASDWMGDASPFMDSWIWVDHNAGMARLIA